MIQMKLSFGGEDTWAMHSWIAIEARRIRQYQTALKIDAQDKEEANIHFNLGGIYMDLGIMAQSKKHYLKTLEIIEQDKSLNEYLPLLLQYRSPLL